MPLFRWQKEYCLGLPRMDQQHREIFTRLAELEHAAASGVSGDHLVDLLRQVREHALFHFAAEERMLASIEFPGLVQQRVQHRLFVGRVRALEEVAQDHLARLTVGQVHSLQTWILGHVVGLDREYAAYLAARDAVSR